MKKLILIALIIAVLLISGCAQKAVNTTTKTADNTKTLTDTSDTAKKTTETTKPAVKPTDSTNTDSLTTSVETDLSEIDDLESELDLSELDDLDNDLNFEI